MKSPRKTASVARTKRQQGESPTTFSNLQRLRESLAAMKRAAERMPVRRIIE